MEEDLPLDGLETSFELHLPLLGVVPGRLQVSVQQLKLYLHYIMTVRQNFKIEVLNNMCALVKDSMILS